MNFCVVNLGCKVNRVESDDAAALLLRGGCMTPARDADLIVVNTCTVTGEAEKKARKAVRGALRANDRARVIVTGCAAAIDPGFYEGLSARVEVVPKGDLARTLADAAACGGASREPRPLLRMGGAFRTRAQVKVQDGCDNACTYCIVHVARGPARSRPLDEAVAECAAYARAGCKEIVLAGINLGSYDSDGVRLAGLLERLLAATANAADGPPTRLRISSIEPADVDERLMEVVAAADGRICRHLHLPMQAGSDRVLREMARPYGAQEFLDTVARARRYVPTLALSTDVIAGFPGETDADFGQTVEAVRSCAFMKLHVFPYSRRAGTPAAARADQVAPEVKAERARKLRALSDELAARDIARRAGTTELAVVETPRRVCTESYHELPIETGEPCGRLVPVTFP